MMGDEDVEKRIREAMKQQDSDVDELAKVTPDQLRHTNMYNKGVPIHELYTTNDPEVQNDETLYSQVVEGGLHVCKRCHKVEAQLSEECLPILVELTAEQQSIICGMALFFAIREDTRNFKSYSPDVYRSLMTAVNTDVSRGYVKISDIPGFIMKRFT